jgi:hypothetical protein
VKYKHLATNTIITDDGPYTDLVSYARYPRSIFYDWPVEKLVNVLGLHPYRQVTVTSGYEAVNDEWEEVQIGYDIVYRPVELTTVSG